LQVKIFEFKSEKIELEIIEDKKFEFLLSNLEVARGYGVSEGNIRETKRVHKDELLEKKHFIFLEVQTKGGKQKKIFWTKQGVIRLGFFIKSERAKKFRDWAEDLILSEIGAVLSLQKLEERAKLLEISEKEFHIFQRVFRELGITRPEELAITTNRAVKKETGVDFLKISEKKGVSTLENYITVTELCEIVRKGDFPEETKLSVSTKNDKPNPRKLNLILEENGFQTRNGKVWEATEKGKKFSDFVQNKSKTSEKTIYHLTWKKEVLEELFLKQKKR
jgi:prophage antirepressor-like protein